MRQITVRSTLLLNYSAIILISLFVLAVLYSSIQVPKLKEQTFANLAQNASSIAASIDSELNQMSTIALNISYSTLIRDRFYGYIQNRSVLPGPGPSKDAKVLLDLLAALIFPNRPTDQINLYSTENDIISSGLKTGIGAGAALDQPWFEEVATSPNHQSITFTGTDSQLAKYFTGAYGKEFVTFAMLTYDNFNNPYGYIEIKQRLSSVVSAAINYSSVYGERIYVFDRNGLLLFPLDTPPDAELFSFAKSQGFPQTVTHYPSSTNNEQIISVPSEEAAFYTIMVINEYKLLQPVRDFIMNIALVTVCALILALVLSYFASRYITAPIYKICRQITRIDITSTVPLPPLHTRVTELRSLHSAFDQMQTKLSESVNKQLLLQTQEMQSRMLALQSQMNPHFLFNSLATIQAMADEGLNDEIIVLCQSMSNILRYISSNGDQEVRLCDEIRYTKDYLDCMVIRYQGDLSYSIQIPEEMNQLKIPKLCLQLLAENAINYSTTKSPPYFIGISGNTDGSHYEITIKDNGPGFSEEALTLLQEQIAQINKTGLLPSLEINGMGLLNIYIRYRLLYGNPVVFQLENNINGGACITIGVKDHG